MRVYLLIASDPRIQSSSGAVVLTAHASMEGATKMKSKVADLYARYERRVDVWAATQIHKPKPRPHRFLQLALDRSWHFVLRVEALEVRP